MGRPPLRLTPEQRARKQPGSPPATWTVECAFAAATAAAETTSTRAVRLSGAWPRPTRAPVSGSTSGHLGTIVACALSARPVVVTAAAASKADPMHTAACATVGFMTSSSQPLARVHAQGVVAHEEYLVAITAAVCEQQPATAAALSEVRVVFGTGAHRRSLHRVWGGEEADEPLPLVEIAAIGGLSPVETCHVLLHELAHVLAPGAGHGKAWRYAARQVGLREPRAWPDTSELSDWSAIAPDIRAKLQAIPEPTERAPADYSYDWHRQGCGVGYGTRGGTSRGEGSGSRYLKVVCQHPGCGYQVRVTRKWLALGTPQCPIADHGTMVPQDTRQASRKRRDLF